MVSNVGVNSVDRMVIVVGDLVPVIVVVTVESVVYSEVVGLV